MNNEKLLKEMGNIDPKYVNEAEPGRAKRSALSWALPMAAAFVLILGLALILPKVIGGNIESGEKSAAIGTSSPELAGGQTGGAVSSSGEDPHSALCGDITGGIVTEGPASTEAAAGGADTPDVKGSGGASRGEPWTPNEGESELQLKYLAAQASDMTLDRGDADQMKAYMDARDNAPDIKDFASRLTAELLRENPGVNTVISPVNVYIALSMVAETADGDTRAEILELLGAESMDALRAGTKDLILSQSRDDDHVRSTFANSLWLNNAYGFNTETLERLTQDHGASAFWGDPADEDFTLALRAWLNEQTGGLLDKYVKDVKLDPGTLLAIASTVYFRCSWDTRFDADDTAERAFHAENGDITCDFMTKQPNNLSIHVGDGFTALGDQLNEGAGTAWFLLPDEGVSIEDMLSRGGMEFMLSEKPRPDWKTDFITSNVILTMPKLDISSRNDLVPALEAMGVTSCFDPSKADFSPLTGDKGPFIGKIEHSARLCADEDGVEAAAYTLVQYYGGFPSEPEKEYVLDRPFVMMIEGAANAPLFICAVNAPNN